MSTMRRDPKRTFAVSHVPAANTQATVSTPTPGPGNRAVVTGLTVVAATGATAPAAASTITANLIKGASGGTSYAWQAKMAIPAAAGAMNGISREGYWVGGANQVMTLEFPAAGGANTELSVSMEGYFEESVDLA